VDPRLEPAIADLKSLDRAADDPKSIERGRELLAHHLQAADSGEIPFWGSARPRGQLRVTPKRLSRESELLEKRP
jgi:hypothetical protein